MELEIREEDIPHLLEFLRAWRPVDIRIIAGINDIILHTRPAVAIPRPACFFRPINPNIIPTIAHGIEIKYAQQDKHNDIIPNTIDATPNPGDSGGCCGY